MIYIEKSKLNIANMWLIPLDRSQIVIFQKVAGAWTWLWYRIKAESVVLNHDTKNLSFYHKCHLFTVLWECLTNVTILHLNDHCPRSYNPGGVLRFELDRGVPLKPKNPYPSLRVILAKKVPILKDFPSKIGLFFKNSAIFGIFAWWKLRKSRN